MEEPNGKESEKSSVEICENIAQAAKEDTHFGSNRTDRGNSQPLDSQTVPVKMTEPNGKGSAKSSIETSENITIAAKENTVSESNRRGTENSQPHDSDSDSDGDDGSEDDSESDFEITCEVCDKKFSGIKPLQQHEKGRNHLRAVLRMKAAREIEAETEESTASASAEKFLLVPTPFAVCNTCCKEFSGPESFHQHLQSKAHKKKMSMAKLLDKITEDGKISAEKLMKLHPKEKTHQIAYAKVGAVDGHSRDLDISDSGDSEDENVSVYTQQFECSDCETSCTGVHSWYQHLVSKKHEKSLRKQKLLESLTDCQQQQSSSSIDIDEDVLVCRLCKVSFSGPESASSHLRSKGHARRRERQKWKLELKSKQSPAGGKESGLEAFMSSQEAPDVTNQSSTDDD